jgi:two-component system, chemotaxis family, protein-glutamate methylesterase/glutaminase
VVENTNSSASAEAARRIIVVGASWGGVEALQRFVTDLPADLEAPVLIVLHIGRYRSILPTLLQSKSPLQVMHATDGAPLKAGQILVAPPDHHMLVEAGRVRLSRGPKEHFSRPAIDPLFRSAALTHGPGTIGIVLTGRLDDGTAGLQAIKACGGIAIVQDPADALEPSMPLSALRHVDVDHCIPLAQIADTCRMVLTQPVTPAETLPANVQHEHELANGKGDPMTHLSRIGSPSTFVCPDCHGSLWELKDVLPPRYRCHTGHAYTLRTLQHAQSVGTDEALWNALRALQEQKLLLDKCVAAGAPGIDSQQWIEAVKKAEDDIQALRQLIELHSIPEES